MASNAIISRFFIGSDKFQLITRPGRGVELYRRMEYINTFATKAAAKAAAEVL